MARSVLLASVPASRPLAESPAELDRPDRSGGSGRRGFSGRGRVELVHGRRIQEELVFSNEILQAYLRLLRKTRTHGEVDAFLNRIEVNPAWIEDGAQWHSAEFQDFFLRELLGAFSEAKEFSEIAPREAFSSWHLGFFNAAIAAYASPVALFRELPKLTRKMNRYNTWEFEGSERFWGSGKGRLVQKYAYLGPETLTLNAELCQANLGSIHGVLCFTGRELLALDEVSCVRRGASECVCEIRWARRGFLLRMIGALGATVAPAGLLAVGVVSLLGAVLIAVGAFAGWALILLLRTYLRQKRLLAEVAQYEAARAEEGLRRRQALARVSQSSAAFSGGASEEPGLRALAAMGELTFGLVHDLGNQMTLVKLHSDLARRQLESQVKKGEFDGRQLDAHFRSIRIATDQMLGIHHFFRIRSRQLAGLGDIGRLLVRQDVRTAVLKVVEVYGPYLDHSGIDLRAELSDDPCETYAFDGAIETVLSNLLQNAVKALQGVERRQLRLALGVASPWLVLELQDSGPGIPAKRLEALWKKFGATEGGTGFGLYQVKMTMDQIGGRIETRSSPQGTSFSLFFAMAREPGVGTPG
jgi:signal transduction histidine kinase